MANAIIIVLLSSLLAVQGQLLYYHDMPKTGYTVKYDNRSFIVDNKRTLLLSGAVHYPRVVPDEWEGVFNEMVKDGLNMVQTYIFWNLHEPVRGIPYDFTGGKDFRHFVELAGKAGLFVTLRIGPFVASEWDYGAIPHWINEIPDMEVRSSTPAWKYEMSRFFKDIVELSKPYLADNGGPIILSQVENEFRWVDPDYINWCGQLVSEVNLGIPFLMCNGYSANNTINSYNGNDGSKLAAQHLTQFPNQPLTWTENEGWYQEWEKQPFKSNYDNRTAEDMAFVVARWFARGAAHHNYYMWYGGNNQGRQSAGQCITNMYAAGTNVLFDGFYNEPKKSHLQTLHKVIATHSMDLLKSPPQIFNNKTVYVLDPSNKFVPAKEQYAFLYKTGTNSGVVFVENADDKNVTVMYDNHQYEMKSTSVLIIDLSNMSVVYNTANVSQNSPSQRVYDILNDQLKWEKWQEPISTDSNMDYITAGYPIEQLFITDDLTDYMFYETNISGFKAGQIPLTIKSQVANSFIVFLDDAIIGRTDKCGFHSELGSYTYTISVKISDEKEHKLTLLSISLGIATHTIPGGYSLKGITGAITLGNEDITERTWIHRKYLQGEVKEIYTTEGTNKVSWTDASVSNSPVWYKTLFDRPATKDGYTTLLDMKGMGRGYFYLNGVNMGRYWLNKVNGIYVQRYYYLPQSLLKDEENVLVLFEEMVLDPPADVQLVQSTFTAYETSKSLFSYYVNIFSLIFQQIFSL